MKRITAVVHTRRADAVDHAMTSLDAPEVLAVTITKVRQTTTSTPAFVVEVLGS